MSTSLKLASEERVDMEEFSPIPTILCSAAISTPSINTLKQCHDNQRPQILASADSSIDQENILPLEENFLFKTASMQKANIMVSDSKSINKSNNNDDIESVDLNDRDEEIQNNIDVSPSPFESNSDKDAQQELEESERLAWELVQQDNMELIQMQIDFMRQNSNELSAEDLAAIQMAVNENTTHVDSVLEGDQGDNSADIDLSGDSQGLNYDRLLELGAAIGDVKTERWKLRSQNVISQFPIVPAKSISKVS